MNKDVLLVIDMQNVYLEDQPWGCASIQRSIKNIQSLLDQKEKNYLPIFTQFLPDENASGVWKKYNEINAEINNNPWMSKIIDVLEPYTTTYQCYEKNVYSSLQVKEIDDLCKNADNVVLTGVVGDCCVLATCFDAIDKGYHVIYLKDACSAMNDACEEAVLTILANLEYLHVSVMTCEEYMNQIATN